MAEKRDSESELGALWAKDGKKGPFLSGEIEGVGHVICFPTDSRNPRAPAWRVLKSRPWSGERTEQPRQRAEAPPLLDEEPPLPTDDDLGF